ncbi:MAG: hypothetical protein K6T26_00420 [Alicyclobacillus sp.]|nr:hypothetical protein [Alicyclobacillus sp.]
MTAFDPLDWIHQWDDFEMMLYALPGAAEAGGVFMQVSRRVQEEGAEAWEILYDRRLADCPPGIDEPPGSDAWEERVLRRYLQEHPELVAEEKAYLAAFLQTGGGGEA